MRASSCWRLLAFPKGIALSPDESRLVINCGAPDAHLYEIEEDGQLIEIPVRVPYVTYDEGPKWFISRWFWASNDVLLGYSSIEDEKGYDVLENRLYAFNTRTSSLARLDLSAFDTENVLDVVSVGKDLSELVLYVGEGNTLRVKADLKLPHKLIQAQKTIKEPVPGTASVLSPSLAGNQVSASGSRPSGNPFPWLWWLLILGVMLGVAYLYRSSRHR